MVESAARTPAEAEAVAFIDELSRGDWAHPRTAFDSGLEEAMPADKLRALWSKLENEGGAFGRVEATRVEPKDGLRIVSVTCQFQRIRKVVRVVIDPQSKVAGLFYGPVPEDLDKKTRHLLDAFSRGDFEDGSRDFGKVMRDAAPPAKLKQIWSELEQKAGRWQAVEKVDLKPEAGAWSSLALSRFERETLVVRVVYDGRNEIVGFFLAPPPVAWSAPSYADPSAFQERAVNVGTSPALPGTLAMPKSTERVPAVILIHGSGPNDRDESVGGVKVFKDLAWGLASKGVAVLRYEKRSRQSPAGIVTQKEEVLDAAHDAVELLRQTPGIDPKRVYVVGHSQGGELAPRIVKENPALAGMIVLAGPTRPLQDSLVEQYEYFASLDPKNTELAVAVESAKKFKRVIEDPTLTPNQDVEMPGGIKIKGAYFLDMRGYDPASTALSLDRRSLILQGERDYQVTMKDFEGWKRKLGSKKQVTLKTYPSLNHLFVSGSGKPTPAEYALPGHVDEPVVRDIAAWIAAAP